MKASFPARSPLVAWLTALAFGTLVGPAPAEGAPPSIESFFSAPAIASPQLSPDGRRVVYLAPIKGRRAVALLDVASGSSLPVIESKDEDIEFAFWKGDDVIVFGGDVSGNESTMIGSLNRITRKITRLAESPRRRGSRTPVARILDRLPNVPDDVLVFGTKSNFGRLRGEANDMFDNPVTGVYRLNVLTGARRLVDEYTGNTGGWITDHAGVLRIRGQLLGSEMHIQHRPDATAKWETIGRSPAVYPAWLPQGFAPDNRTLHILAADAGDTPVLHTYDTATRVRGPELFRAPEGEISALVHDRTESRLLGVRYETDRVHFHWFDEERARVHAMLRATFPDLSCNVVNSSVDGRRLLVRVWSDRNPGEYYVLDLDGPRLVKIGPSTPAVVSAVLRPMESVKFMSRDGLTMHGYLTRPADADGKPVPLIVYPHGGPFGIRDRWGYDATVQFLASRGYAVLQVNYRGSGGYGRAFLEAGRYEWGRRMQDDLTDAVKWAVANGHADPARIGIFGASYGGYATLAGLTFTPELYRVGINYSGVSDLRLITRWQSGESDFSRNFYESWIGSDAADLAARSPVLQVAAIKVPSLHAYGENDPRVDIRHWELLERELKRHRKTYEVIREKDEGHGFDRIENRVEFFRAVESFLAKHL